MRKNCFPAVAWLLLMGVASYAPGQVIPIDDFNDKDPSLPGWSLVDLSDNPVQPWGPGSYDPSSGALRVYHTGDVLVPPETPFATTAMFALWNDSVDPLYSNGFLRAKIRTNESINSTAIEMRLDLLTATGYLLFGMTKPPSSAPELKGTFLLNKFVNGAETVLWNSGIEYLTGEDWNIELGAVGDQISGKVWRVGDLEPIVPQFVMTDPDPILGGMLGISSDKTSGNPIAARGDGTFDDIVFNAIPEPSSTLLILMGLATLTCCRRK